MSMLSIKKLLTKTLQLLRTGSIMPGDSVTVSNVILAGAITNGSQDIYVTIPLGKTILATSCTITGTMTIRANSGFVYDQAGGTWADHDIASYLLSASPNSNSGTVNVLFRKSSAWTTGTGVAITNNTPLVLSINATITFSQES